MKFNKFDEIFYIIISILLIFIIACTQQQEKQIKQTEANKPEVIAMKLTSPSFANNGQIPSEFTCDSSDVSPPLTISDAPENAKSIALIMDDPDAPVGTFVHWVVWNIPIGTKEIRKDSEPSGIQGKTGFGRTGYGGPCPPSGTHRYFFKLYALDTEINLPKGSSKKELEKAMEGHIMEKAELMGTYIVSE